MVNYSPNRKLRIAQGAVDGFRQVLQDADAAHCPVLDSVNEALQSIQTNVDTIWVLGLACFTGIDAALLANPVTSANWHARLRASRAWSKLSDRECDEGEYLLHRDMLTPEELTRARRLIEKLERHQRQGVFDFDVIDDDRPF